VIIIFFILFIFFFKKLDNKIEHLFNHTVRANTDYNLLKFETELRMYDKLKFRD
jgi:hypothetical protein